MVSLEKSKLFSGLLPEELGALQQTAHLHSFKTGQVIFTEGDPGDGVFVITEGLVQISALVNQNERRVLSRVGPGDFFGEMAVLDSAPRSATATAEKDTEVYFIDREQLMAILFRNPKLALSLVREFSLRMREMNRQYMQEVLQAERLTLVGRFARSIVHDFKNPLNVIGLAAEMAGMEKASLDMRRAAQARIQRQVSRLSNMINELLEFTRGSQAGSILGQADYGEFVTQLIEEIRPEIADKHVIIEFVTPPPSVVIPLDPKRMPHIFYNLIHNAVDAMMPGGGRVTFRFTVTDTQVITEAEDTGKGIPPEIAGRLFEPFATFGKAQGTGLGLSICKKIVEDHRGYIQAKSEAGRGAVFTFALPLK